MSRIVFWFISVVLGAGLALGQQTRNLVPRQDSPTAMRRCGAELESVKAQGKLMRRYVFSGSESLIGMQYCVEGRHSLVDDRNTYRVPAGTLGWLSDDGLRVVLEQCVNQARCKGCPPKPAPPPPPPPPGIVRIQKEQFDSDSRRMSNVLPFEFRVGNHRVRVDHRGFADVELPQGSYDISELPSEGWEMIYASASRVAVESGKVSVVLFKNRQFLPPPPPPTAIAKPPSHECAVCVGFESSVQLTNIDPSTPLFKVIPHFKGEVTDLEWTQEGVEGGLRTPAINIDPSTLAPGSHRFRVTGKDSQGHTVTCSFVVTVNAPTKKPGRPTWSKIPLLNCGYQLIPGLGGFKRHGAGDIVEKGLCVVGAGAGWYFWPAGSELVKLPTRVVMPTP